MLFFERLHEESDDAIYKVSKNFSMTKARLEELVTYAIQLDYISTASFEELYGAD